MGYFWAVQVIGGRRRVVRKPHGGLTVMWSPVGQHSCPPRATRLFKRARTVLRRARLVEGPRP